MRSLYRGNAVLLAIPPADRKSFASDLEQMQIRAHVQLSVDSKRFTYACFPTGAVISILCSSNRRIIEVHGIGREGMLGPRVLFTAKRTRFDLVCQIGGPMLYMPSTRFEQHLGTNAGLRRAVALYSMSAVSSLTQSVACNGLHSIAQRCARGLLTTVDRVDALEFALTHELLARMLGVRRSGVSVAVYRLQGLGIIRYRFGRVSVLDRERLELESCECYHLVRSEAERIFKARATKTRPD